MKQKTRHISILLLLWAFLTGVSASCTDDLTDKKTADVNVDDTGLVETGLTLNVSAMDVNTVVTEYGSDDSEKPRHAPISDKKEARGTDAERRIDNIWVFQFNTSGQLLITPRYYDISDLNASPDETDGREVRVLLKPDVESIVYVVANTGNSAWATVSNSRTLDDVKQMSLPQPDFIAVDVDGTPDVLSRRIPMEGASGTVTPTSSGTIAVKVTRMFAKVEISINYIPETLVITDVDASNIPFYCRVSSLDLDDENDYQRADYPSDTQWISHAFKPGPKNEEGKYTGTMVIYIPENLQGRNSQGSPDNPELKTSQAYAHAFCINFKAEYVNLFTGETEGATRSYVFYPGANNYNDYNIKRNNIYRVTLDIFTDLYNQDIPSSNCFVVKPGQLLSFLPYYRTEEGGGYKIEDYLDGKGNDETKKIRDSDTMTDNIKIIWQTKDAIGDNTAGDLVRIDRRSEATDEFHRKIYVHTGKEGNALIAAYNNSGDIVWSWHIWVTENEPANLSSAVTYSTYAWNESGIYTDIRVPGYAVMPCNIGALRYEPQNINGSGVDPDTHGMLYQWGRKDPFPPARSGDNVQYDDTHTGKHYANDNTTAVTKTSGTTESMLFHSLTATDMPATTGGDAIRYTIKHPTVFLCGTYEAAKDETYIHNKNNYPNNGDWREKHDDKLWGGKVPVLDGSMKYLYIHNKKGVNAHIFDNYGDQKSVFDPCPSGWRVPPGDLWLGFTSTGLDPVTMYEVNTDIEKNKKFPKAGMYLYMTDWQSGATVFFPTQGTRTPDGRIMRTGSCGNYHNATTDVGNRVNILHVHNDDYNKKDPPLFHVFETEYYFYYVKSCGGPVRCVRDHK